MIQSGMDRQKVTQAAAKVGGYFKLVALIQRRTREIVKSGEKPTGFDANKLPSIILDDILEGTVYVENEGGEEK